MLYFSTDGCINKSHTYLLTYISYEVTEIYCDWLVKVCRET